MVGTFAMLYKLSSVKTGSLGWNRRFQLAELKPA